MRIRPHIYNTLHYFYFVFLKYIVLIGDLHLSVNLCYIQTCAYNANIYKYFCLRIYYYECELISHSIDIKMENITEIRIKLRTDYYEKLLDKKFSKRYHSWAEMLVKEFNLGEEK